MSYTALVIFKNGKQAGTVEYRNAWGGAARIWDAMFKRYIPKKHEYDCFLKAAKDGRLWKPAQRKDLPEFERAVHAFTFDRFYVRRENLKRFALCLRDFARTYPPDGVCHLRDWAQLLDDHPDTEAVGLYATSVGDNLWERYDAETDSVVYTPLSEGNEVFDWIKMIDEQNK